MYFLGLDSWLELEALVRSESWRIATFANFGNKEFGTEASGISINSYSWQRQASINVVDVVLDTGG